MRIAFLTDGLYPHFIGGIQKHSTLFIKYLAKSNIKVDVYYRFIKFRDLNNKSTLASIFTQEELDNIHFLEVDYPRKRRFPGHYLYENYLYSKNIFDRVLDNKEKYDIIYVQGFSGWYLLGQKGKYDFPITIINFHGLNMYQKAANLKCKFEHLIFRPFVKWNISRADYAISLGGKLTPILKRLTNNILELPVGVEERWVYDIDQQTSEKTIRKFVFIGRYERLKGIEELQKAIIRLPANLKFQFEFIGPIPGNKRIKHLNVKYWDTIYDENLIMQILRKADVLVCPSWSEGMPTVILEAMASGCAVIASNVGAVSVIVDDTNGWLISKGSVNEIKIAVEKAILISSEELISKKYRSVQKVKEKFTWDSIINLTLNTFKLNL